MKSFLSRNLGKFWRRWGVMVALFAIVAGGFSFRAVHFDEWLYFKLDQARDAMLVSDAVEKGPAYLPLLGQRVGAIDLDRGLLRVGPVYYYFQYLSGVLSGSVEPWVFAYPDLLFGVLAIPMLFLVARLAFSVWASLLVSFLLSVSFLGIEYSRFAWNPNPLPFFFLLSVFGVVRFANEPPGWRKYFFLALWALGFGVGVQLHFFGMMSLLGVTGVFFLWKWRLWNRERVRALGTRATLIPLLKYTTVAGVILLFLSAPIVANEVLRGGENTRNFIEAMTKKQDAKPLVERIGKAWDENGRYWCLMVTSECLTESDKKNRLPMLFSWAFLVLAGVLALVRFRRSPAGAGKDILFLLFAWSAIFFVLSIPVAFQLRPRFFLVVLPIPFLLFGALFEEFRARWKGRGILAALALLSVMAILNIRGTLSWFAEQQASQAGDAPVSRTIILKNKDGVTLGQLRRAADRMYEELNRGDRLYFYVKPEHIAPFEYLFEQKEKRDPGFFFEKMTVNADPRARFFAVVPAEQTELQAIVNKFDASFSILSFEVVGQIAVSEISFANRTVDPNFRPKEKPASADPALWIGAKDRSGDRMFWGDVFLNGSNPSSSPERSGDEASGEE